MKFVKFFLIFIIGFVAGSITAYFLLTYFPSSLSSKNSAQNSNQSFLPQINSNDAESEIPILMYHHIKINPSPSNQLENSLSVSPDNFKKQISYLYSKNYKTIFLDNLFDASLDKKIAITFDDGYKDVIENAYPILKTYGYQATVFLIYNDIGKEGYLSWRDITTLQNAGWSFGSHTLSHPNLTNIQQKETQREIEQSKVLLEVKLGKSVNFFAYPAGLYNEEIIDLVKEADYKGAVTTLEGKDNQYSRIYELKRVRVSGYTTLKKFIESLEAKDKTI